MFDLTAKRDLNRGFSDSFGRGVDLALTPVIIGAFGWLVDRWLGTDPIFTLLLATAAVVGTFAKLKIGYDRQMAKEEAGKPWSPRTPEAAPSDEATP